MPCVSERILEKSLSLLPHPRYEVSMWNTYFCLSYPNSRLTETPVRNGSYVFSLKGWSLWLLVSLPWASDEHQLSGWIWLPYFHLLSYLPPSSSPTQAQHGGPGGRSECSPGGLTRWKVSDHSSHHDSHGSSSRKASVYDVQDTNSDVDWASEYSQNKENNPQQPEDWIIKLW